MVPLVVGRGVGRAWPDLTTIDVVPPTTDVDDAVDMRPTLELGTTIVPPAAEDDTPTTVEDVGPMIVPPDVDDDVTMIGLPRDDELEGPTNV